MTVHIQTDSVCLLTCSIECRMRNNIVETKANEMKWEDEAKQETCLARTSGICWNTEYEKWLRMCAFECNLFFFFFSSYFNSCVRIPFPFHFDVKFN